MRSQTHGTLSSVPWRVIVSLITLVIMVTALSSCGKETKFPTEPPEHRLLDELNKWPDEYYWLVETGVASRVMGIRESGDSIEDALERVNKLVSQVKADWSDIAELDTADKLQIKFMLDNHLPCLRKPLQSESIQSALGNILLHKKSPQAEFKASA